MWNPNWDWNEYWRLYIDCSIYKEKKELWELEFNNWFFINDINSELYVLMEALSRGSEYGY